jgi:hypothetical protein
MFSPGPWRGTSDTQSKLVEVGFGGLVQLLLKMSNDGMGRTFEPEQLLETGESSV